MEALFQYDDICCLFLNTWSAEWLEFIEVKTSLSVFADYCIAIKRNTKKKQLNIEL